MDLQDLTELGVSDDVAQKVLDMHNAEKQEELEKDYQEHLKNKTFKKRVGVEDAKMQNETERKQQEAPSNWD